MIPVYVPPQAVEIIKQHEGLRLEVYQDSAGHYTIGYGHKNATPPPCDSCTRPVTPEVAEGLLKNDLEFIAHEIQQFITTDLNDNQMSAVISFAFNLGAHAFAGSTLLKEINAGNFDNAADEFLKWDHAGGRVLPGLLARRTDERNLFLKGDTNAVVASN
jgi:lysozyme